MTFFTNKTKELEDLLGYNVDLNKSYYEYPYIIFYGNENSGRTTLLEKITNCNIFPKRFNYDQKVSIRFVIRRSLAEKISFMGKSFPTVQDGYDYLKTLNQYRLKNGIDIFYSGPDAVSMQFMYAVQDVWYRHYGGVSVCIYDFPKCETYDENTIVVYTKTSSIFGPHPALKPYKHILFWENDDSVRNVRSRIMNVYKNYIDKRWKYIFKHKEKSRRTFEAGRANEKYLDSYYKREFAQVFVNIMTRVVESLENRILYNIITEAIDTTTVPAAGAAVDLQEYERLKTIPVLTTQPNKPVSSDYVVQNVFTKATYMTEIYTNPGELDDVSLFEKITGYKKPPTTNNVVSIVEEIDNSYPDVVYEYPNPPPPAAPETPTTFSMSEFVSFNNICEKIHKDLAEVILASYSKYIVHLETASKTASRAYSGISRKASSGISCKTFCDKEDADIIIEKLVNLENYEDIVKDVKEYIKTIVDEKLYDFTSSAEVRSIFLKSKKSKYFCETTRTFDIFLLQPVLLKYLTISVIDISEKI